MTRHSVSAEPTHRARRKHQSAVGHQSASLVPLCIKHVRDQLGWNRQHPDESRSLFLTSTSSRRFSSKPSWWIRSPVPAQILAVTI